MTMLDKGSTPLPAGVADMRAARFARLVDHYESDGHDQSTPGADRNGRFAVVSESERGHGYSLTRCSSLSRASMVAVADMGADYEVLCVFDLDVLDGPDPEVYEGDTARITSASAAQAAGSYGPHVIREVSSRDGERTYTFENGRWAYAYECAIVDRAEPDERLPVHHDVAAVVQQVIFNTVPTTSQEA